MKTLLDSPMSENIAEVWDDEIEPILLAQQRAIACKEGGCTPDELKGFTVAYNVLELFAKTGKERITARAKNQPKPQ